MKVGDRVSFPFAGGIREGIVHRIHEKTVWIRADFPRHPGKLIRRKIRDAEAAAKGIVRIGGKEKKVKG